MKYKDIELKEIPTTERQFFTPPKEMYVWDADDGCDIHTEKVAAIIPERRELFRVVTEGGAYTHCAEVPKPKLATYGEFSQWLAKGNGRWRNAACMKMIYTNLSYDESMENEPVNDSILVRKWKDTEWHSPTREYLGLED